MQTLIMSEQSAEQHSKHSDSYQALQQIIATIDPERWLAVSYAPAGKRLGLAALFALDVTLGNIVASTTEPMIGAMRLAWWREALEKLATGAPPAELVLKSLSETFVQADPGFAGELATMVDGWLALIEVDQLDREALETHGRGRGEALFALAVKWLGEDRPDINNWGRGWALIDLASRLTQAEARSQAMVLAGNALNGRLIASHRGRPLLALALLARRDAHKGVDQRRLGSPRRQLRMLVAFLTGR